MQEHVLNHPKSSSSNASEATIEIRMHPHYSPLAKRERGGTRQAQPAKMRNDPARQWCFSLFSASLFWLGRKGNKRYISPLLSQKRQLIFRLAMPQRP